MNTFFTIWRNLSKSETHNRALLILIYFGKISIKNPLKLAYITIHAKPVISKSVKFNFRKEGTPF